MLPSFLLDVEVDLQFTCGSCSGPVGALLKCAGKPLGLGVNQAVETKVPCPNCNCINRVLFSPDDGSVLSVVTDKSRYLIPEPSVN